MQTIITVAIAAVALIAGFLFWQYLAPESVESLDSIESTTATIDATVPRIVGIEFPDEISADGEYVRGVVRFRAPTGNLVRANFEILEATFFAPFEFDPEVRDMPEGEFEFYISSILPQKVTIQLTLTDDEDNVSEPKEFSFEVTMTQGFPGGN